MTQATQRIGFLVSLLNALELSFVDSMLGVVWRIIASVNAFTGHELNPRSFEWFERRPQRQFRELARLLIQRIVNQLESADRPDDIQWDRGRTFVPHRRFWRTMETHLGTSVGFFNMNCRGCRALLR